MKTWIMNRLKEPSTWRGLVWLLTVAGITLTPEQTKLIVTAGMALAGLLGVFLPERNTHVLLPAIELQSVPAADDRLRQPVSIDVWRC
jgi:hypothetical protein